MLSHAHDGHNLIVAWSHQMSDNDFSETREELLSDFMRTRGMPEYGSRIGCDWLVELGLPQALG